MEEMVELTIDLTPDEERALCNAAAALGVPVERFIVDAIEWRFRPKTSRNMREGYFIGRSVGKAVRWNGLVRRVRSAKARAVMARRTYRGNGVNVPGWAVE